MTNSKGFATLNAMQGNSARCYYDQGDFTIVVSSFGKSQIFSLTVLPTPPLPPLPNAKLSIISGNNQKLARMSDGAAKFAPMAVLVSNEHDQPIANAYVSLDALEHPSGMAVQVDPSGGHPTLLQTDQDGIATFQKFYGGYSVLAYYATGPFSVGASVQDGPTVSFNCEVTA